jgi:transcriptional regulator with XRE-family HTH domain
MANRLPEMLQETGVTQAALARKIGRTSVWMSRRANGRRGWKVEDALAVASALSDLAGRSVTVEELFGPEAAA